MYIINFVKNILIINIFLLFNPFTGIWSLKGIVAQSIEATIAEDDLVTLEGLPWGGKQWPYSQTVEIQESLVASPVGRVVLDRHGIDRSDSSFLFKRPFSSIEPGKSVFISLWGSKIEGCFAEMIIQVAPKQSISPDKIVPSLLELGIGNQILQLKPQQSSSVQSYQYTYTKDQRQYNATWYMVRQLFVIDSNIAKVLSDAKPQTIKARLNFGNNSLIISLGEETTKRWKYTYGFNPACQPS